MISLSIGFCFEHFETMKLHQRVMRVSKGEEKGGLQQFRAQRNLTRYYALDLLCSLSLSHSLTHSLAFSAIFIYYYFVVKVMLKESWTTAGRRAAS